MNKCLKASCSEEVIRVYKDMTLSRLYEAVQRRFDDGDVGSPLDFKYVTQVRLFMSTIGAWPYKHFGRHRLDAILSTFNLILIAIGTTLVISCAAYLRLHIKEMSFFDMGHFLLCILLTILYVQRMLVSRLDKYQEVIRDYLLEFHLFYRKSKSEYAAKIHSQIHVISRLFTIYVICQMVSGPFSFTVMPLYNNYRRGMFRHDRPENTTFEHSVYFYCFTETVYTTTKGYWILFVFNIPVACTTSIGLCAYDLLLCLIVFQILGHLKILSHNLLNMPLPADTVSGMYSAEENIQIRLLLKENIEHHKLIVTFVEKTSDAFSEYLLAFYMLMQLITCISLLELSALTPDAIVKYAVIMTGMHQQLIQVSILFEMLNTKSQELMAALYAVPWERMNVSNRRTVQFFLHRVQTPISLKAGKVVSVGVTTMSMVLKNTFMYYMMLRTVAGERQS